jgi:hypothetical protein
MGWMIRLRSSLGISRSYRRSHLFGFVLASGAAMAACSGGSKHWAEAPSYVAPTVALPTSSSGEVWSQLVLATPQRKVGSMAVSLRGPLIVEGVCGQVRHASGCYGYWYCTPIASAASSRGAAAGGTVAATTVSAIENAEAKERSFFVREILDGSDACASQGLRLRLTIMEGKKAVIREE